MTISLNPRADQTHPSEAPRESTGPIAADSLAAESLKDKGAFAENENAHALGVKGNQSTLNNTDTSGATTLPPAETGSAREKQDALRAGADEKGTTGLKLNSLDKAEFTGHHSHEGYAGGPSSTGSGVPASGGKTKAGGSDFGASGVSSSGGSGQEDSNIRSTGADFSGNPTSTSPSNLTSTSDGNNSGSGPGTGSGVRPHVDAAPNYTQNVTGSNLSSGTFKPKGSNLEDADVTQSIPQTKTFTGDVGGVHDPGRLAERDFEGKNTDPNPELGQAGEEGGRQRDAGGEGRGGQYDVLESERA